VSGHWERLVEDCQFGDRSSVTALTCMAVVHGEAKWTHLVAAADGTGSAWLAGWLSYRRGELDAVRKIYADAFGDGIVREP
jgi:hypothetical protein